MITSPAKAIRAKCLDCCNGSSHEVNLCPSLNCPLYPFRFGKNPYRAPRHYSQEQLDAARERMKRLRSRSPGSKQSIRLEGNNISSSEGRDTPEMQMLSEPCPSA